MKSNLKSIILRVCVFFIFFVFVNNLNAQTQQFYDSYNQAVANYNNYNYSYVPNNLQTCINEIWYEPNKAYYQRGEGQQWVFTVYKLLIDSNNEAGFYEDAERNTNNIINYFNRYISAEDVMNNLNN